MMSEAKIQKQIIDYLTSKGAYVVKTIQTNRSGTPDLICCLNGLFLAVEVKTSKGVTSALQEYHLKLIGDCGGIGIVACSVEDVKIQLKERGL